MAKAELSPWHQAEVWLEPRPVAQQRATPAIVVLGGEHLGELVAEMAARYARDYAIRPAPSLRAGLLAILDLIQQGIPIAMVVSELTLPDGDALHGFAKLHAKAPTARRVVMIPRSQFRGSIDLMREGMSNGDIDGYLVIPQGPRDEEFHSAIAELLSDWGWSVNVPEVDGVRIISNGQDQGDVTRIHEFFDRMGMPTSIYAADSPTGVAVLAEFADTGLDLDFPLVHAFDGTWATNPSLADLGRAMSGSPADLPDEVLDLVVVGAGPAGLAAAVYGASEGLRTVVFDAEAIGGQAGTSSMIRNYLGFPRGISGMRLAQRARAQAARFGATFYAGQKVTGLVPGAPGEPHVVEVDGGARLRSRSVLVATGVKYRRLGLEAVEDLVGQGVNYGAASSTARDMAGRSVYVVGGGNSAGQAAVHLSRFARQVTILIRREDLSATMSDYLIREIAGNWRITVRPCCVIADGGGDGHLEWLVLRDLNTGVEDRVEAKGLYLMLGASPFCGWLPDDVALDDDGFVLAGGDTPPESWSDGRPPAPNATTVPGVFVAGDVRSGSMKRVASASGEGAAVVPMVHAYLADLPAPVA